MGAAKSPKPETETARRARHRQLLADAAGKGKIYITGQLGEGYEIILRAATFSAIPGRQKRSAAYMLQAREDALKAACRRLREVK